MIRRLYVAVSPLPLLFFVAFQVYTGHLEGWGAWVVAPLFLPIVALSAVQGTYGLHLAARAATVNWRTILMVAAILAGSIAVWFIVAALAQIF